MQHTDVVAAVRNSHVEMRRVLEWLDQKDGLGLDAHKRISEALSHAQSVNDNQLQRLVDPEVRSRDVDNVLRSARDEIRTLRRHNEIMAAQLHVIDVLDRATRGVSGRSEGMSIDIAWQIDQLLAERRPPTPTPPHST